MGADNNTGSLGNTLARAAGFLFLFFLALLMLAGAAALQVVAAYRMLGR